MDPTFIEMEAKRQAMIASFQEVAAAMTKCAKNVNDFARAAPAGLGVTLPIMNMPFQTAPALATTPVPVAKPRKNAAPIDNPAAAAAATPTFAVSNPATTAAVAGAKRGRKPTKEKKIKDPNAPKRPPSAYLLFQNEVREEMRKNLPAEASYKDVLQAIAARWKDMSAEQKAEYSGAYDLANTEYKLQDADYKNGPAEAFAAQQSAAALQQAATPSSGDSSSEDDSDDDSDDEIPVKPVYQAPPENLAAVSAKKVKKSDEPEKKKRRKSKVEA